MVFFVVFSNDTLDAAPSSEHAGNPARNESQDNIELPELPSTGGRIEIITALNHMSRRRSTFWINKGSIKVETIGILSLWAIWRNRPRRLNSVELLMKNE